MNSTQAKKIPIEVFLDKLNHKPTQEKGTDLWYKSPLRDVDNSPSFKVNRILNTWYDFGYEKGGSIVDLVCFMYSDTVSQALKRLSSDFGAFTPVKYHQPVEKQQKTKNTLILDKVCEISENPLFALLKERYINLDIAKQYLKQIYFSIKDKDTLIYALAMQNDKGNYEFKNKYMKGCIGSKAITSINLEDGKDIAIFEGMLDFLAFLTHHNITNYQSSAIILNSVILKRDCLKTLKSFDFKKAYFFLDNDNMGKLAFEYLSENIDFEYVDKSNTYKGFNDYNEFLIETINKYK